jgi:rhodanese-related sulfurtransferase
MRKTIFATIALFAAAGIVRADDTTYPDITHDELVKALQTKSVTLLDANGTESYKQGHIPTAINFEESEKSLASLLPADKNALIVAYCANEQCRAYGQAAKAASELGYTNVKHYAKGIMGWKASGAKVALGVAPVAETTFPDITHDELVKALQTKSATLLDANGTETFKEGHIPTAIDFEQAEKSLASLLPADKNALIVAYCGNEQCSAYRRAAIAASELGYTNVKHYAKGIVGWKASGAKVEAAK